MNRAFALPVFIAIAAVALAQAQPAVPKEQPVLILLYSRFSDHSNRQFGEERLFRMASAMEQLRKDYPGYPIQMACEFSGTFTDKIVETNPGLHLVDRLREMAKAGWIDIGYSGEDEPTYRNRPQAALRKDMTPEQRWQAHLDAAWSFLNDFKDHLTGVPDPKRPGGLRRVSEALGQPVLLHGIAPKLGGEAPYFHQLRRMGVDAVMPGFPDPYFTIAINGYRDSASQVGRAMSDAPGASPELFWDSNYLRYNVTTTEDIRRFQAEEGKEALQQLLAKLDRSRVRILTIEVFSYARYLNNWPDGTPRLHPLVWAYDHPDSPGIPGGIRAFGNPVDVYKSYDKETETLRWLAGEFLPANKGSRFVRPGELMKMSATPVGKEISAASIRQAADSWKKQSVPLVNMGPTFVKAGDMYLSAADLFLLLANSLDAMSKSWKAPEKVRLTPVSGPIFAETSRELFPHQVVTAAEVARAAAALTPKLNDQTWMPVPNNAVPVLVSFSGLSLIPQEFLALMVEAYLAQSPDQKFPVRYQQSLTAPGYLFPRQNTHVDAGHTWTLRPAPLRLD